MESVWVGMVNASALWLSSGKAQPEYRADTPYPPHPVPWRPLLGRSSRMVPEEYAAIVLHVERRND